MRQKSDISERTSKGNPYFVCNTSNCVTEWPVRVIYTKNEYSLFYQKFDVEYFFIWQFFRKKPYFQRKPKKTVSGGAFENFLGKESVLHQKLTYLFYHNRGIEYFIIYQFFPKMYNFLRKRQKTVCGTQVSFEGKEGSRDENEYNLF